MRGKRTLYIDQYNRHIYARTVAELRKKAGGGRVSKMYTEKVKGPHAGKVFHTGYVVGKRWFAAFAPVEIEQ